MSDHFVCGVCGKAHAGLPTDWAFKLPDVVWAIPETERSTKAQYEADLCRLDGRYFIRCVLPMPLVEAGGDFAWGVWAEVGWPTFERYLELYAKDGTAEPPQSATLANAIPVYEGTLGTAVLVQFGNEHSRPSISLMLDDASHLAMEHRNGIDNARHHEISSRLRSH